MTLLISIALTSSLLLIVSGLNCYNSNSLGIGGGANPNMMMNNNPNMMMNNNPNQPYNQNYNNNNNNNQQRGQETCYQSRFCVKKEGMINGRHFLEQSCDEPDPLFPTGAGGLCQMDSCFPMQGQGPQGNGVVNVCCCDHDLCNGSTGVRSSLLIAITIAIIGMMGWLSNSA